MSWLWGALGWIGRLMAGGGAAALFFGVFTWNSPGGTVFYELAEYSLGLIALGIGIIVVVSRLES